MAEEAVIIANCKSHPNDGASPTKGEGHSEPEVGVSEQFSKPGVDAASGSDESIKSSSDARNSRPPSLLAHESAVDYESFCYSTLPNSAAPDVLARWRQLRIGGGQRSFSATGEGWDGETCCKKLLRRRVILFLVLVLSGVIMAAVTVGTVWVTAVDKNNDVHGANSNGSIYSS